MSSQSNDQSTNIITAEVVEGLNRKYLRVADLRRLQNMTFTSRRRIEGLYSGRHATPQRGHSVEFRDYREYIPGDDLAHVDWKVFGRSDRLFIKLHEHQADLTVHLLVDASASMAYRGIGQRGRPLYRDDAISKYDQACFLAAAIGFLVAKQSDRVSLAFAQQGLYGVQRPASSMLGLAEMLAAMESMEVASEAKLAQAIRDRAASARRRDLLIVLSDLLEDRPAILQEISAWTHRGGEAIVFHLLHPDERDLPPMHHGVFIDSETQERLRLHVNDIREAYTEKIRRFLSDWSQGCRDRGVDYDLILTSDPYYQPLENYMIRRSGRIHTGGA